MLAARSTSGDNPERFNTVYTEEQEMELSNEFEVATDLEEAWSVLTDIERIAPCLPGAELREVDGEEYRGVVKVKVGPITAEYKGVARLIELDAKEHRAVLRAEGRESRGQGTAAATITATLEPSEKGTRVSVQTDLSITGKVAQFGRGVLADVSAKLLAQFAGNLESMVLANAKPQADAASAPDEGARSAESVPAEPVDLVELAGGSLAKRLVPLLVIAAVAVIAVIARRKRG